MINLKAMINLTAILKQNLMLTLCALVSIMLMQGCGGQRDEPFNGNSSSSKGAVVALDFLGDNEDANVDLAAVSDNSKIEKFRTNDTFVTAWKKYHGDALYTGKINLDFSLGQVLLYDQGRITSCDRLLERQKQDAYVKNTDEVMVTFYLHDANAVNTTSSNNSVTSSKASSSSTSCTPTGAKDIHPFIFLYVHSRAEVLITEDVD